MKAYLNYSGLAVLAHRGGSIESFENTLASFEYAQSVGCTYIETDVQVSSDGIPYIFHDESLKRITGKDEIFSSLTSHQIDELRIFDDHVIPTLDQTLKAFPNLLFQIDLKTDMVAAPALKVIKQNNAENRVCIASFSSKRLKQVQDNYPEMCLSMGPNEVAKLLLASFGLYRGNIPGDCLQVPMYSHGIKVVTKRFIKYAQSRNLKIMVWTINDEKTLKKLINLNVDGIITDKPKLLHQLLKANF